MKADIKERWINALLSGGYKQGRGALFQRDWRTGTPRFCAVGVLCDLAVRDGVVPDWVTSEETNDKGETVLRVKGIVDASYSPSPQNSWAPAVVLDWAGIYSPIYSPIDGVAVMNDEGKSFAWIANKIKNGAV